MPGRVTLHDVARRAHCSVATVSRVLNDTGPASAEVRERVTRAVRELGFRFNEIGRSLQSRRSRTLGILVPTLSNPVFAAVIEGAQTAARARGYQLLLACANYRPEEEASAIETLLAKQVDGLLLTLSDADDSAELALLQRDALPFVLLFNQPSGALPAVTVDNRAAAQQVARTLLAAGHRDVAYVAGRFRSSDRSVRRYEGFAEAYRQAGAAVPSLVEVDYGSIDHRAALAALLTKRPGTTALFCSNDMLALAVAGALRRLGKRVPDDISLVGFDGIAVAALVSPSLATVVTPSHAMGARAADRLVEAIEGDRQPSAESLLLPFEFRPGESLAPRPGWNRPAETATPPVSPVPQAR
ncbi:MAG: substrate-binding domain-containing protein [Rhodospirillales bacterium]